MKENTKRLLVWLYPTTGEPRFVPKSETTWVLDGLSSSGMQSLLYLLEKKQYLESQQLEGVLQFGLTQYGVKSIEAEFPALSSDRWQWQGEWTTVVCLSAPKTDKNFRYLRELMISHHLVGITRGVFMYPGAALPVHLQSTFETLYPNSVAVLATPEWLWGDERSVIGLKTNLYALMDVYSGISNELARLITNFGNIKTIDHQSKLLIASLFDRLYGALQSDFGLGRRYFPRVTFGRELLSKLQLYG